MRCDVGGRQRGRQLGATGQGGGEDSLDGRALGSRGRRQLQRLQACSVEGQGRRGRGGWGEWDYPVPSTTQTGPLKTPALTRRRPDRGRWRQRARWRLSHACSRHRQRRCQFNRLQSGTGVDSGLHPIGCCTLRLLQGVALLVIALLHAPLSPACLLLWREEGSTDDALNGWRARCAQ